MGAFFTAILAALGFAQSAQAQPATSAAPKQTLGAAVVEQINKVVTGGALTRAQVEALAQKITAKYYPSVDWRMLTAMAFIESNGVPTAKRIEYNSNRTVRDVSYGLMQVLTKTAMWLYTDLGARAYGAPSVARLSEPEASIYFGAAYVNWLRRYNSITRSTEWIVRGYNGGQGWASASATSKAMTLNHWTKYQAKYREFYGG